MQLRFLGALDEVRTRAGSATLDTSNWVENWVPDTSNPGLSLPAPVAVEVTLQLEDFGEMRRLYALPPL